MPMLVLLELAPQANTGNTKPTIAMGLPNGNMLQSTTETQVIPTNHHHGMTKQQHATIHH
jgi:hypothetical protein